MGLDIWVRLLTVAGTATGAGVLTLGLAVLIARFVARHDWVWVQAEVQSCRRPSVITATTVAFAAAMQRFPEIEVGWRRGVWIPAIGAVCWLLIYLAQVGESIVFHRLPVSVENNHRVRRTRTQVAMLRRLIVVAATGFGLGGALLVLLPGLPAIGASFFASAGLAGIVAAMAAQATLANVLAGMQLAFTDAVRIDDVVVVEGEWGWIEEITLTYVVLHIWDERRLVLPTSYFTTTPFQNWTRHQAQLLGSVILHLDYAAPLTALREHTRRVLEASPLWDRQGWVLQVTNTTETTMVVRVLASAKDGPTSWDLCCDVREALLVFLQEQHPEGLPVRRLLSASDHLDTVTQDQIPCPRVDSERLDQVDLTEADHGEVDLAAVERQVDAASRTAMPRRADLRRAERSAGRHRSTRGGVGQRQSELEPGVAGP